ncbi:hypothetical protein GWI33_016911 [Rhynchophorus ferrugineus]|uniref:Uncharacterized protein n=1 Tax=Rhynchophorus ferrugineus TaxID=354439 RepID=A0A834I0X8_RHYFE|nr:hypothetical protein GWI33_016911 [Rhynchophorus ferrugineus]
MTLRNTMPLPPLENGNLSGRSRKRRRGERGTDWGGVAREEDRVLFATVVDTARAEIKNRQERPKQHQQDSFRRFLLYRSRDRYTGFFVKPLYPRRNITPLMPTGSHRVKLKFSRSAFKNN